MPVDPDLKIIGHFAEGKSNFYCAIGWPSMKVRDAAWREWMEKGHKKWQNSIGDILSYD
tara:strand:+ start:582 stop:758 length:177 start_codon:yes stop_codon:yes gene_type:complete